VATEAVSRSGRGKQPRIGVFGCGCWFYWDQFPGLRERLVSHQERFERLLRESGQTVISGGLIDSPDAARAAGVHFRQAGVDFLFCYMSTYALSSAVLPVVQRAGAPLVIVSLQPTAAMDYAHGTTEMQLEYDNQTSLPEVCYALNRAGLDVLGMVVGAADDERAWERILEWCKVARAFVALRDARIGLLGHPYEGMLDMNADPTSFDALFGMHCQHLELDDLADCVEAVGDDELGCKSGEIEGLFDFPAAGTDPIAGPVQPDDLLWAARVACGLDRLVDRYGLTGLAYYYRGLDGNANERLACSLIVGSSLLTARGIPIAGEMDLKTCIAMLLFDRLGAGGSFCELHPCDFGNDIVLVGHDGPHHLAVAQGRPILRGLSLYHGKRGSGVSVEFQLRTGPITCAGLTQTGNGGLKFVLAEGESMPGPIPPTGNTNTRCRFYPDVATFVENWSLEGPTHHFALGVGHIAHLIAGVARCFGIECVNVTDPAYRRRPFRRRQVAAAGWAGA